MFFFYIVVSPYSVQLKYDHPPHVPGGVGEGFLRIMESTNRPWIREFPKMACVSTIWI